MAISVKVLMILCIIYLWCEQMQGIRFGQSDLTVQEGSSKNVSVRRSGSHPVNITVFAATIEEYRRFEQTASDEECGVPLSTLIMRGANESQVDPAESNDLLIREYSLTYGMEEREKFVTLQVADDGIAENEETFILYTNFTEALSDRCATPVRLQDNDVVKFNFSRADFSIREDENLPSRLSIIKTGQIEPNISFQVYVYPVEEGPDETDFIAHSDHLYVFTNETNELPIATELVEDMLAEDDEVILICLPSLQEYRMAETADPDCVRVTINDDDPVMIGFSDSNTSLVLSEGAPFSTVCISIKQGGFPLDPSSNLELTIQTESIDGEVLYGNERLEFDSAHLTSCKTITGLDDHISDGTHTSMLTIGMADWSSVPVIMSPGRIPISVMDVDVTTFELLISENDGLQGASGPAIPIVQEGTRAENVIKIQKRGYTAFAYNVLLDVQPLSESQDSLDAGFILNTTVKFQGSTSQLAIVNIPIDVLDDSMPEKQTQFIVSIIRIVILNTEFSTGSTDGARTAIEGQSIRITIYDNDFIIGFVNKSVDAASGGTLSICVAILEPNPPDIDPMRRIPVSILVSTANTTRDTSILQLEVSEITLSATNTQVCTAAVIQAECEEIRNATIELNWKGDPSYNVNFQQRTLSITCQKQQGIEGGVSPMTPTERTIVVIVLAIVIPVIVVALIIIIVIAVCAIKRRRRKRKKKVNSQQPS